jgi:hypothetical protein
MVQHVSSSTNLQQDLTNGVSYGANPGNPFYIDLPNQTLSGNALLLSVTSPYSSSRVTTITDDKSNTWSLLKTVNNGTIMSSVYAALNASSGTQKITVRFDTQLFNCKFDVTEFYNVVSASALDASSSATLSGTNTIAAGPLTTASSGDLVYHYGFDTSNTSGNGNSTTLTAMGPAAGFAFLTADIMSGAFVQYGVQSAAGTINPAVTLTGGSADAFNTVAVALRAGQHGTAPGAGIRIAHVHHVYCNRPVPIILPSSGNLLYVTTAFGSNDVNVTSVSSVPTNSWTELSQANQGSFPPPQGWYAPSASTSPNLSLNLAGVDSKNTVSFVVYDIVGAATSPFDTATYNYTDSTVSQGSFNLGTITPHASHELVIATIATNDGAISGVNGSGITLDSVTYGNEQSADTMENADGYAHFFSGNPSPVTFGWVLGYSSSPTENTTVVAFKER